MSVQAKIDACLALAASTTFHGEREAALAAAARLQRAPPSADSYPASMTRAQIRDRDRAIQALGAVSLGEVDGVEMFIVEGHGAIDERELFMLWVDWQARK